MVKTAHLLKVGAAWTSIAYVICFVGVALFPDARSWFMEYALHTSIDMGQSVTTVTTFITGLAIWNVLAVAGLGLFAWLSQSVKE